MAVFFDTLNLPSFKNAVVTIGTFDGVHLGHKTILNEAVQHAKEIDGESILLTFEPHPRKLLFPDQPIWLLTPLQQKLELITQAGINHIVVVPFTEDFANLSAEEYIKDFLVKLFRPAVIVIGYDHRFGHDRAGGIDLLKQYKQQLGYEIYEISAQLIDEAAVSSTKIRNALKMGYVSDAAHMLGRSYSIQGTVVTGAQLGRTIGYPTANISPSDPEQLIPANGVYAVKVKWKNQDYNAMLNIGIRPTVSHDLQLHIEAHLFSFNQDLYGALVEITFVERLRNEEKFPSLDALKAQLARDEMSARKVLEG